MKLFIKDGITSVLALFAFTLLTGILYPLMVTAVVSTVFPDKARGSLIEKNGIVVGSQLLAQPFADSKYFWPRPSAVKYDSSSSGATNLSPASAQLLKVVQEREAQGETAEMRFASASGLDPHISPESARYQATRVGRARKLSPEQMELLQALVRDHEEPRQLGFLGQPRVNVLGLNLALDEQFKNERR